MPVTQGITQGIMVIHAFLRHQRGQGNQFTAVGWGQGGDWKFLTLSTDSWRWGKQYGLERTLSFLTRAWSTPYALLNRTCSDL